MADIDLTQARQAVDAALNKAKEMGVKMDIVVVDAGANLKAFARMDGAWFRLHRHRAEEGQDRSLVRHANRRYWRALSTGRAAV